MDINGKCRKLPVLRTRKVEWGRGEQKSGVISLPFPIYGKEVDDWIGMLYSLKLTDQNYLENYDAIQSRLGTEGISLKDSIAQLSRDEVLTVMTFIVRKERFCDGTIAHALEDGTLEALCVRLHAVTSEV